MLSELAITSCVADVVGQTIKFWVAALFIIVMFAALGALLATVLVFATS